MYRKSCPVCRMPGVAGGIIPVFSRKPAGTSGRILEKCRMPGPADELKRRIRRVFSFPGLPPEFLGASPEFREGPSTFPEGPETSLAALETLQAPSKTLAAPLKTPARVPETFPTASKRLGNDLGTSTRLRGPPQAPRLPIRQALIV
jgi:hypothetical protein